VKHGLAALLNRIDHACIPNRQEILIDPLMLFARQTALGDVERNASEMRRNCLTRFGSGITVMPPKLLLLLSGTNCGVNLDGLVELCVEGFTEILGEITGPRTAVAAIRQKVPSDL